MADSNIPPVSSAAIHGPYEDAIIAGEKIIQTIIERMPQTASDEIWKMLIEDLKEWRAFWRTLLGKQ